MEKSLVDKNELMSMFKFLTKEIIYTMTSKKLIPYYKLGKGRNCKLLFDVNEVEAYIRSTRVATRDEVKSVLTTQQFLEKRKNK